MGFFFLFSITVFMWHNNGFVFDVWFQYRIFLCNTILLALSFTVICVYFGVGKRERITNKLYSQA
jgi:hypothetical protein